MSLGISGVYFDYIIAQSDWFKNEYKRCLDEYGSQSEENRVVIEHYNGKNKFVVLGNPKYDKVTFLEKENYHISRNWRNALFYGSKQRLTILLDMTVELVLKQRENIFRKINAIIDYAENNKEMVLIWRPHPLLEVTVNEMTLELEETYWKTIERCREYQYVPADFEQKETFGEIIYKFSKEALVRKISK